MAIRMLPVRGAIRRVLGWLFTLTVLTCAVTPARAAADVVVEWNELAADTVRFQAPPTNNPFAQARFMAITQLAVFEAVNAITQDYEPYLGTIQAAEGASVEAAAVEAAYTVLATYFATNAATMNTLNVARNSSLAAIPDGAAKTAGLQVGHAAAVAMMQARTNDGAAPAAFYLPTSSDPGQWRLTPSCSPSGGAFYQWGHMIPFGIPSVDAFMPAAPPALTSAEYAKDLNEVMVMGAMNSTARPADRTDVARFYAASSPSFVLNSAARQVIPEKERSLSENARALALLNMAVNDALVASFATKYTHTLWRPETAINGADTDDNPKTTAPEAPFVPLIAAPCFPSYTSNHASGSYAGLEVLARLYGQGGHSITLANAAVPTVVLTYSHFNQIGQDVDDARVYGGIHFRFDQRAGARLGSEIATYVYKENLRRAK